MEDKPIEVSKAQHHTLTQTASHTHILTHSHTHTLSKRGIAVCLTKEEDELLLLLEVDAVHLPQVRARTASAKPGQTKKTTGW